MRPGQEADKPISLVPYSRFYGEIGCDPNRHVSEFLLQSNANNARTPTHWHSIFPTTLEGQAKLWFHRQPLGQFCDWNSLKDAFVNHFRPMGYEDHLSEQLQDLTMDMDEAVDSYYGRLEDIVLRLPMGHGFTDRHLRNIFVKGLVPHRLKSFIKLEFPATLAETYERAKHWESVYYEDTFGVPLQNQPPIRTSLFDKTCQGLSYQYPRPTLGHPLAYPPSTHMPQNSIAQVAIPPVVLVNQLPVVTQPYVPQPYVPQPVPDSNLKAMADKMNELTSQKGELKVHCMDAANKKGPPVDDRANVWCTNCKGQGHMKPKCPSPQSLAPKCRYCDGNHDISICTKMIGDGQHRNQNGQVYQVDNGNPNDNSNNNNGGSNNNGNWNRGNN
jgi:hypothetical protein